MNQYNYRHTEWNSPFIAQRADPYVLRHGEKWYFTASVPEYDRIALRCVDTLEAMIPWPDRGQSAVCFGVPTATHSASLISRWT